MPPADQPALHDLLADAGWVRRLAGLLAGNAHDADDLAQDACLLALRQPPSHGENLRGWFHRVLQNLVRQHARTTARRTRRELEADAARLPDVVPTDDLVERATTHRAVVDAVLRLDEPHRAAILLRFFEDLPPREIAARLGIPVATVHSRLLRGCTRLRHQLDATFGNRRTWCAALLPLPHLAATLPSLGVFVMNGKALSLAATVALGAAALWFGSDWLAGGATMDAPVSPPAQAVTAAPTPPPVGPSTPVDPARLRTAAASAATPVVAEESQQGTLAGRLVDGEGRALAALEVELGHADRAAGGQPQRTRSDAVGTFTFPSGVRNEGRIRVVEPNWQTVLHSVVRPGEAPPTALVVAAPAVLLAGQVRTVAGLPVAGAMLQVAWPADLRARLSQIADTAAEEVLCTQSGDGGRFSLAAARVRGAQLVVTAEGFVPHRRPVPEASDGNLVILLDRPESKPGTIQGQVVDPRGMPAVGAHVGLGAAVVRTDAMGNFLVDDDGKATSLSAAMAGHRRGVVARPAAGFPPFVVVALGATPLQIRGRVVDQDGAGLAGVTVWANDPTILCEGREPLVAEGISADCTTMGDLRAKFERGELRDPERVLRETPTASWPWVTSGADGSFRLTGLEDRPYRLRAMDPRTLLLVEQEGVAAGSVDTVLRLRRDDLFSSVKGRVVSRNGEGIPGVRVRAQIDTQRTGRSTMHGRTEAMATTDAEGLFTLRDVPKQHVYLRLEGDRILPVEYGRGVAGGLLEQSGGDVDHLRIEVGVRMHVQVELLEPASADALAVLDAAGRTIVVNVFSGRGRRESDSLPLSEGKSPVFVVPDTAATLVLSKAGREVRREVLQLRAGDVNTLRY